MSWYFASVWTYDLIFDLCVSCFCYFRPYQFLGAATGTGAGWWPGRKCQFYEFNCYKKAYQEADAMLAEIEAEERRQAGKQ